MENPPLIDVSMVSNQPVKSKKKGKKSKEKPGFSVYFFVRCHIYQRRQFLEGGDGHGCRRWCSFGGDGFGDGPSVAAGEKVTAGGEKMCPVFAPGMGAFFLTMPFF